MRRPQPLLGAAIGLIRLYRSHVSSRVAATCAYDESCSEYALRQLRERGLVRGAWAAYRRYRSCDSATAERLSLSTSR
jgi:putative component of membrane protein insertase Oxa1/YidC/SpoIIIJ protein YidD